MKYRLHPLSAWLLAVLLCLPAVSVHAEVGNIALPEMGDSSSTVLSLEDELRIGREMLQQLDSRGAVIHDPVISDYIQRMGRGLAAAAVTDRSHFYFFAVKSPSINAFAMPGGFIGIHSGLILASESESELAAVVAHEIAHVTQHHIARSVERAGQMNLPMTAAVIAAILLGGGDPQIANAAIAASMGGSQQMQIDFTRANEKEADRIGIQLLAGSDLDPRGMGNFFARLQSENRYYGQGAPEFLRTHPVTTSRIAEAEDRARQYPLQLRDNSIYYLLVKARLRLLQADSVEHLQQELTAESPSSAHEQEAHRYLQALVLQKKGDSDAAHDLLSSLLKQNPGRIAYIHELARLETSRDKLERAAQLYRRGLEQYPGNEALTLAYARNMMLTGKHDEARKLLEQLLRDRPLSSEGYRLLARLESDSGNLAASYLAQAEHYYLRGEPHSAIDQLNTAKRLDTLPHYYATRIEARLEQLKDELERYRAEKR